MAIVGVCIGITIEKKNVEELAQATHKVKGVLANDIKDMDNITAIEADELAVSLEYRGLDVVAYDLSSVDLSSFIADNSTLREKKIGLVSLQITMNIN